MSFYQAMVHIHSVGRWIVLLLLLFAIINSLLAGRRPFIKSDNRLGLLLTSCADLMLLIGFYLYFSGPWGYKQFAAFSSVGELMRNNTARFFAIEHMAGMLIAIVLMHIGKAQSRKPLSDTARHRRTVIYYLLALVIILASVPWPFREIGHLPLQRGWY